MSWTASANDLAGVDFYLQEDSLWSAKPEVTIHTPIGATDSVLQSSGCPSYQRTVAGYVTSSADYTTLIESSRDNDEVEFNGEDCYILNISAKMLNPLNLTYLALVTCLLVKSS